jgi:hypothetical protein
MQRLWRRKAENYGLLSDRPFSGAPEVCKLRLLAAKQRPITVSDMLNGTRNLQKVHADG